MPQRTRFILPSSSNPSDFEDEEEEFFMEVLGCDDFWWDEEDRHELF